MRAGHRTGLAAAGVLAALALFFAPALLGAGEFIHRDTGLMHGPMKRWIGEELRAGRFPAWNPYAGLGTPLPGNAIDALQHPFTALLLLLPPGAALTAWILLSFALAALGAVALARTLGASPAGAAVAALGFALSGPLVSSSDNVTYLTAYAALPWLLAAGWRLGAGAGPGRLAAVGLASALCAAAGDPQAWGLAVGLLPLAGAAAAGPGQRRAGLARGALGAAVAAAAAAPFLLPVIAWLPNSRRTAALGSVETELWNLSPVRLVEFLLPGLFRGAPGDPTSAVFAEYTAGRRTFTPWFASVYLGAALLPLALLGAARDRRARLLLLGAALFTWAALGPNAGFGAVAARLPLLGAFRYWEKLTAWVALLTATAAALGFDALVASAGSRRLATAAGAAAAALLGVAALATASPAAVQAIAGGGAEVAAQLAENLASGAVRAGVVAGLVALLATAAAAARLGRALPVILAAAIAFDLSGGNASAYVLGPAPDSSAPPLAAGLAPGARVLSPFAEREDRWPELDLEVSKREWSRRTLGPAWNVPLRVGTHHDYVGLREARWAELRRSLGDGPRVAHLGLFAFAHLVVPGDPALSARAGAPLPPRIEAADPALPAWRVELPHRPRAYLAGEVRAATPDEALAFAGNGGAGGGTVVEGPVAAGPAAAGGEARLVEEAPCRVVVEAASEGRALLVLNDAFAPGWRAEVDGREAAILRANALVRGVWLEPGRHRVVFDYRTPGLREGWWAALLGAVALAGWALGRRVQRRSRREKMADASASTTTV